MARMLWTALVVIFAWIGAVYAQTSSKKDESEIILGHLRDLLSAGTDAKTKEALALFRQGDLALLLDGKAQKQYFELNEISAAFALYVQALSLARSELASELTAVRNLATAEPQNPIAHYRLLEIIAALPDSALTPDLKTEAKSAYEAFLRSYYAFLKNRHSVSTGYYFVYYFFPRSLTDRALELAFPDLRSGPCEAVAQLMLQGRGDEIHNFMNPERILNGSSRAEKEERESLKKSGPPLRGLQCQPGRH
ncbi:MAG: hypothetical protein FJX42_08920 [Alphaproteobacteria bacterium]|nr:hypothetical protein [Alphaproteobacteria bacterium]